MENSYRFFSNRACKYFPCHKGLRTLTVCSATARFTFGKNVRVILPFWILTGKLLRTVQDVTILTGRKAMMLFWNGLKRKTINGNSARKSAEKP